MLWYRSWLETRWRFLIGLALTTCSAALLVLFYPRVMPLLPSMSYDGYVRAAWFRENLAELATLFAILLGAASTFARGAAFTLSLPFLRGRLVGVRAATGLAELLVIAFVPSLLIPLLSPVIGKSYGLGAALFHSGQVFLGVSAFYALALLLSTIFLDRWRPVLIALAAAFVISVLRAVGPPAPWLPFAGVIVAAGLYCGAVANAARRDF